LKRVCSVINSMKHILLWKIAVAQSAEKFHVLYETQSFTAIQTSAHHWTLPSARRIHSSSSWPISLQSVLILSRVLCTGLSNSFFLTSFPIRPHIFIIFLIRTACTL
jgi:hypothetical protein